jgi:enoyl-CoA hydratase/carnithine racemase
MTGLRSSSEHVRLDVPEDHIALIQLDRPDKRNAITSDMARMLEEVALSCEQDPDIRVVVLAGAGCAFCAGADLKEVAAGRASELRTERGGFAGLVDLPRAKPWIVAVCGAALAGGFEIALSCDIIVAADDAVFSLPEVRRGLVATGGGVWRLPQALPRHVALDLIATGEPLSAPRAFELGLVSEVVPSKEVLECALAKARSIAGNSPIAVRESLALARTAARLPEAELRAALQEVRDRLFGSGDAAEGASAFLEKRAPQWRS